MPPSEIGKRRRVPSILRRSGSGERATGPDGRASRRPGFRHIADAARELGHETIILDGEAVVLDASGRPDFGALQQALGGRAGHRHARESILMAFDLLYLDGQDLTGRPLVERRQLIETILVERQGNIQLSERIEANGDILLQHVCDLGLEGIIAKRLDRPYRSGRTGDWLKVTCSQAGSFAIVGYEPSVAMQGAIGRLLLAARKGEQLVYVGGVGTGFTDKTLRDLKRRLDEIQTSTPVVTLRRKGAVYVEPTLVAEIQFRAWTHEGKLRHASFKRLREPADNAEVAELPESGA
ncbi:non-homologous end-joining DNA ligase [Chelativorans sp. AA-79]|uniref:non-homologous end-joining DNA ligase n=1 Tax=Chelativorans sp. AA-79 TaxID=3028735 RepID=UPI0023F78F8D|nr:non-homologous end-joining DNA ligase [Chelativorans sp. AA-79]WEX12277.1 non-homologous end-joining DNA ligase [Chelativorans sp. AA-79]